MDWSRQFRSLELRWQEVPHGEAGLKATAPWIESRRLYRSRPGREYCPRFGAAQSFHWQCRASGTAGISAHVPDRPAQALLATTQFRREAHSTFFRACGKAVRDARRSAIDLSHLALIPALPIAANIGEIRDDRTRFSKIQQ